MYKFQYSFFVYWKRITVLVLIILTGSSGKFEIRIERKELESGFGRYCEPVFESGAEREGAAPDAIDGAKR